MNNSVSIIGQSWTLNKDENCSFYDSLYRKLMFTKSVLAKYHKPTLWVYFAAGNTTNSKGTCNWTLEDISRAMSLIYIGTPALVSAGTIGMGHYQFLEGTDPQYNCSISNCSFGLLDYKEVQKQPVFNMWFKRCNQYYSTESRFDAVLHRWIVENMSKVPLVFSFWGDNGSDCDGAIGDTGPYKMIRMSTTPEDLGVVPMPRPSELFACDRCFGNITAATGYNLPISDTALYPETMPHTWYVSGGTPYFDDLHMAVGWHKINLPINCDLFRASFRKHSELGCKWEMDPLFVRAVSEKDSQLQTCSVRYTRMGDASCNSLNLAPITDPANVCPPTRTDLRWNIVSKTCEQNTGQPGWNTWEQCKACTYGLLRCKEYPNSMQTYNSEGPYSCGKEFNPYDVQMGLCCGTNTLCSAMEAAANWAYAPGHAAIRNELLLSADRNYWGYDQRDKWTILLMTLVVYHANGDTSVLDDIYAHWQATKWCPNSVKIPYWFQGQPSGPNSTFIWTYCSVYNTTGSVFRGADPDPWLTCRLISDPGTCRWGCCGDPSVPGSGYWTPGPPDGQAILPSTIDLTKFDTNPGFADLGACLTDPECCDAGEWPHQCPGKFDRVDPTTYKCNPTGSCCGGSFFEHLCCKDPYACEVLYQYNQTLNRCDKLGFCKKA
jgi:hypothetical protein